MSTSLDPDQDRQGVGPDLSPNCLQRLSATTLVDKELCFFFRLFSQNHHLKKLFTKLITSEVSGEVFLNEELLQNHARIVMESLSAAVECLHDSKQLTALLIEIGERHAMYGVKPHMIRVWCLLIIVQPAGMHYNHCVRPCVRSSVR